MLHKIQNIADLNKNTLTSILYGIDAMLSFAPMSVFMIEHGF
jgi:hypothetical protein